MFSAPNHVNFLLTHQCNLQCNYCYVPFQSYSEELNTEQIIRIIDLLYERGVFSLDLTGGEPLLRKDIVEILKYCNVLDMDVGLATNGVLLTKEEAANIGEAWNKKRTVHISVDASTPETFFKMTGSRDFTSILESTETLLECNLDVIWNFVYTVENRNELTPVCELALSLGVTRMFVLPVIEVGRAVGIQLSFQELQDFLVHFPEIEKQYSSIQFRVTPATPLDFLVPLFEAGWDLQEILRNYPYARTPLQDEKFKEMRNIGCIGGVGRWAITAQGDVYPCELLATNNRMKCGNLLENSFQECLDSCSSVFDVRLEEIGSCASCKYATICGGGCRARAFTKYSDLYAPDPLCPFSSFEQDIINNRSKKSRSSAKRVQGYRCKAFTVKVWDIVLRVRREQFGGTVYVPGCETQIYVNKDGYIICEILQETQDENEIMNELTKRKISIEKESLHKFLNQLVATLSSKSLLQK